MKVINFVPVFIGKMPFITKTNYIFLLCSLFLNLFK